MNLSSGHEQEENSNLACRLKKSIYELKQSPRAWYDKLSKYLIFYNFTVSSIDHSLFTKNDGRNVTIILVYVDDLIITKSNEQEIILVKQQLRKKIDIKDLGYLKYFLGIYVAFKKKDYSYHKEIYALNLLKETGEVRV
jgi:Reverse transcriptase (RNA-dependent DNA polymerase)